MNGIAVNGAAELAQLREERRHLQGEREVLLREHYPLILDTLSIADELAKRVRELRTTLNTFTGETLPQLEALTTFDHVENNIVRPHRERSERLRQNMKEEQKQRQKLLVERSIQLLQSNVSLSTCLRVVSTLKQQREFIEEPTKLERVFLDARRRHLTVIIEESVIKKKDLMDNIKLFEALVKAMREPVLDVVTQYRAAFSDLYPLSRFLVARIDWFLVSIEALIKNARNTLVLASFWNQLVLLNAAYVGIGASFLPLVEPVFVQQAMQLINASASASWQYFQAKGTEVSFRRPSNSLKVPASAGKDIIPPMEITEFPWLALMINCFVDVYEQIQVFAIPPMKKPISSVIDKQLTLFTNYFENRCRNEPEESVLAFKQCLDTVARPFVEATLEGYFAAISSWLSNRAALGTTIMLEQREQQEEGVTVPSASTTLKEGYLRKQAHNFGRDWGRRYFVLSPTHLSYYRHHTVPQKTFVKSAVGEKYQLRRFRLLTPAREYLLEAESEEDAQEWSSTIHATIISAIMGGSQQVPEGLGGLVCGGRMLVEMITAIDGNNVCADCGTTNPTWVSINLGIVLCIDCSGIHRSLGCQISKVRSLEYDTFMPETIDVVKALGNRIINAFWGAELSNPPKMNSSAERCTFIEEKYLHRVYTGDKTSLRRLSPVATSRTPFTSPELSLFSSVQTPYLPSTAALLFHHGVSPLTIHHITRTSALHCAAAANQLLQVHLLLLNGAEVVGRDGEGRTAAEVALRCGNEKVAEHLVKFMGMQARGLKRTGSVRSGGIIQSNAAVAQRIRKGLMQ
ncbi:Stromal membrane-associated GTPase-activating protein 2 [Paramicrosporidium saccamoebae]|uniref:Stromal membrane-associated GTPase-activating protein 2 n=1 Tax=Paramicrosporidium saccamoebae TaxID=1246581 RepID=A0A2H9TIB3_9FUNG|nr:Stromal membrane-associated GTPase-activating protein 2 [Paramicrosporidium saccamoebae]